jgi:ABC-2 type transport system ATP-binding protein
MIRILATLVRPDSGSATVAGHDLLRDPDGVRGAISLTGQYAAVDDKLTGRENLEMMARLLHLGRRAGRSRTTDLLAIFDLTDVADRRAATYSGGLKRRLDLAIAMIKRPELIFLDEPTTGLDTRSREQVWGSVRDLADDGVTVLLTTQYLEEADQLADTIALLDRGRLVASGTADELKASVGAEVVQLRFGDSGSYDRALLELDPVRCDSRLRLIEVASSGTAAHVRDLLSQLEAAGAPVAKVSAHRPSLDDVFLSLTDPDGTDPDGTTPMELTR